MWARKRNNIILFFLFTIVAIPIFLGIPTAQAVKKTILKIEKDKKKITEPSKKPVKEVTEADRIKTEAEKGKVEAYSYDPTNKIDPFKSFILAKKELEEKETKTYLEILDISQLTVSAIVLNIKDRWALVRDSKGDGHIIKVGTRIGKRRGRVSRILEKEVIVTEYYKDIRGREIVRNVSMKLPVVN